MKLKQSNLFKTAAFALVASISVPSPVTAEQQSDLVEYLDNGYLTEQSVEALRKEQKRVHAISAYEYALPVNGFMQWTRGHLAEAEYGD